MVTRNRYLRAVLLQKLAVAKRSAMRRPGHIPCVSTDSLGSCRQGFCRGACDGPVLSRNFGTTNFGTSSGQPAKICGSTFLCKAPRLVSIVPKGLTGRLVLMTFIREILVDVLSEFAMTTFEVPSSFVQNTFAIGAFEVRPKPKMQEKTETFATTCPASKLFSLSERHVASGRTSVVVQSMLPFSPFVVIFPLSVQ